MMSPKSLNFIAHLKQLSNINFGHSSNSVANSKMALNRTMNNFNRTTNGFCQQLDDSKGYDLQSKDKRNQMDAPDVKQFIMDDNERRNMSRKNGVKGHHGGSQDISNQASYVASSLQKP